LQVAVISVKTLEGVADVTHVKAMFSRRLRVVVINFILHCKTMGIPIAGAAALLLASPVNTNGGSDAFSRLLSASHSLTSAPLVLRENSFGIRGIHIADNTVHGGECVAPNDILLSVPLSSCLRSDRRIHWDDIDETNNGSMDPDQQEHYDGDWPFRLSQAFLQHETSVAHVQQSPSYWEAYLELLPDRNQLHKTLPVHWSEKALKATSLKSFKIRSEADWKYRSEIKSRLLQIYGADLCNKLSFSRTFDDLYDLITTRACQIELDGRKGYILAPVFDMLNHASHGWNNASYKLERTKTFDDNGGGFSLVVRSKRELDPGEEILIDYGECTRDLNCLHNYGFLPTRGNDLAAGAEVTDEEGNIYIFQRESEYGIGTELLGAASDAVRREKGLEPLPDDESLVLGEDEALWIIHLLDKQIRRTIEVGNNYSNNGEVKEAAAVRRATGRLLRTCRERLLTEKVKSPLRKLELTLRKPSNVP
jgi:hypothetical protein